MSESIKYAPQGDELLDLVNEQDQVVGTVWRSAIHNNPVITAQVRVVWLFLRNQEGKVWIARRHPNKKSLPLGLDASVVGCVASGETYEQALHRETLEEVNLDLTGRDVRCVGSYQPRVHGVQAFYKVYELAFNQDPDFNKDDFIEGYWLTSAEFFEKVNQGIPSKQDLLLLMKWLY